MANAEEMLMEPDNTNDKLLDLAKHPAVQASLSIVLYTARLYYIARNTMIAGGVPEEHAGEMCAAIMHRAATNPINVDSMLQATQDMVVKFLENVKKGMANGKQELGEECARVSGEDK